MPDMNRMKQISRNNPQSILQIFGGHPRLEVETDRWNVNISNEGDGFRLNYGVIWTVNHRKFIKTKTIEMRLLKNRNQDIILA